MTADTIRGAAKSAAVLIAHDARLDCRVIRDDRSGHRTDPVEVMADIIADMLLTAAGNGSQATAAPRNT